MSHGRRTCPTGSVHNLRAFEFLGGVPEIVPDNLKSGVTRSCRYEPGVNVTYEEMSGHYGIAVVPARPYSPRVRPGVLDRLSQ
jgi:transposase